MSLAPLQQHYFRRACSKYATGVTILTVLDAAGAPHGMTVNSFTSVSLDPPLVLACIDLRSYMLNLFSPGAGIGVNILREDQAETSTQFARSGQNRFGDMAWSKGETGVPILPGVLASLECVVRQNVTAGDHAVLIAEVMHVTWDDGQPLLYFNSGYHKLHG